MQASSLEKTTKYRRIVASSERIVIKIGSALISDNGAKINTDLIAYLCEFSSELLKSNKRVVIVSSGAIAEGMSVMKFKKRPKALTTLQALAAVGQVRLIQEYEKFFERYDRHSAQVLLTHDDIKDPVKYKNAYDTINYLLDSKVVPIINENDVIASDEINFGDNDRLAAITAQLIRADLLLILTDQDGLFTTDPRKNSNAELIGIAEANDQSLLNIASKEGGTLGSGGMYTKVMAASLVAQHGAHTVIVNGEEHDVLRRVMDQENIGTLLHSSVLKKTVMPNFPS